MTASTVAVDSKRKDGERHTYPVAASTKIPAGVLVCVNASGKAVNGSDTSGLVFVGVALETVDNSAGAADALEVQVERTGLWELAVTGTAPVIGAAACISDNVTVAAAATTTNDIPCGIVAAVSGSKLWVDIAR
ncbi:hypothetical protein CVU37_15100 [candidate division BRC1 bacterium HGW-BRC1-1]|jgi:hypothetical protein|nr:MAG: hypothetical protein CVU37_15100 [candidate division BRC1 bacterium HGW-BRC1-1]